MSTFKKKDFESNDGMLTYIWGPPLWHFLHTMSFNYPVNPSEEDKNKYESFLLSMGLILPCRYCRENFYKNIKAINFGPKDFKNRNSFSKMIFNLHEEVNKQLNKQSNLTYEDVRNRYEHFRSRCNQKTITFKPVEKKEKGCTLPEKGKLKLCSKIEVVPYDPTCKDPSLKISDKCKID